MNNNTKYDTIRQSNRIITNRKEMSRLGQKVYFEMLRHIGKYDENFSQIIIPLKTLADEWNEGKDAYRNVQSLVEEMNSWMFWKMTIDENTGKRKNEWISILSDATHIEGSGFITININEKAKDDLLKLQSKYTKMNSIYLKILSKKAALLYQMLCCNDWNICQWEFTSSEFKEAMFVDENKYCRNVDFEKWLLQPLISELNEKTDMDIQYKKIGRGKNAFYRIPIRRKNFPREKELLDNHYIETIVEMYTEICVSLQPLKGITSKRKALIQNILDKGYSLEDIETVFSIAENSDYLSGKINKKWRANFTWLMKEDNFINTLEGAYSNKTTEQNPKKPVAETNDSVLVGVPADIKAKWKNTIMNLS